MVSGFYPLSLYPCRGFCVDPLAEWTPSNLGTWAFADPPEGVTVTKALPKTPPSYRLNGRKKRRCAKRACHISPHLRYQAHRSKSLPGSHLARRCDSKDRRTLHRLHAFHEVRIRSWGVKILDETVKTTWSEEELRLDEQCAYEDWCLVRCWAVWDEICGGMSVQIARVFCGM